MSDLQSPVPEPAGEIEKPPNARAEGLGPAGLLGLVALAALTIGGVVWGIGAGRRSAQQDLPELASERQDARAAAVDQLPPIAIQPSTPDTAGISSGIVTEGLASLGEPAPDFRLETPQGDMLSLSDFEGQPVLINFWATWCPPCVAELPFFEAMHAKHHDEGLVVLAVNVQEPTSVVLPFLEQYGFTFPVALDLDNQVSLTYRVGSYPTTFLVDRKGRVVNVRRGAFINEADLRMSVSLILPEIDS